MNLEELNKVAEAMVAPGKGILAADESTGTIKKRFDAIGTENTEDNRRDYRELMFRTADAMKNHISGVILYDETIWQKAKDGTPLVDLIKKAGAIPGQGCVCSQIRARRSTISSRCLGPLINSPTGNPAEVTPAGIEIEGSQQIADRLLHTLRGVHASEFGVNRLGIQKVRTSDAGGFG